MKSTIWAALAATTLMSGIAHAGPAWEFETATNSFNNGDWIFANSFTVLETVTVSGLGYYADPFNGQVEDNQVALYSCDTAGCLSTGTLLASAVVTNAYPIVGHFRYVTIPELTLLPGEYLISGVSLGNNYTWNNIGFYTDSSIQYNDNRWLEGSTPDFLNFVQNDTTDGYWGPNLFLGKPDFTGVVPEPATWAMMIGGFALAGATMRRRKTKIMFA
ncbi:PEPxxWA-CTERM sorting domain-containing protein [Sphingobium lignivorans]|uniref:Ice-binding protein C-terminal domain-containing protein n=1 Tax=Sphingobium lignivorans TaxID=2735886 RepID=A0ABR6NEA5_9SPHN|nr:PEPxxWA-CTERM sorting domain-containing protein [Sphingobium lignivorans]MBB5985610.1 hypothetical protein [Sphingobium lignivorans]